MLITMETAGGSGGTAEQELVYVSKGVPSGASVTLSDIDTTKKYYLCTQGFGSSSSGALTRCQVTAMSGGSYTELANNVGQRSGYYGASYVYLIEPSASSITMTIGDGGAGYILFVLDDLS